MANYLTEAFKELRLVEQDFDISADKDKIDELKSFVGDDIEIEEEPVYDVNATDSSELADNYIGKVILECECCHSRIYKDIDDVVVDDSGVANVDEPCPLCKNELGFTVIGKIDEFNPEGVVEDEPETEDSDVEKTPEELEDEEAFPEDDIDESLTEDHKYTLEERIRRKHLTEPRYEEPMTEDQEGVDGGEPEEDPWGPKIDNAEQDKLTEEVNIKTTGEDSVEVDKDDLGNLSINISADDKETTGSGVEEIVPLTQEEEEDIKNNDLEVDSLDDQLGQPEDQLDHSEENDQVEPENDTDDTVGLEPEEVEVPGEAEESEDDENKEESLDIKHFNEDSFNKLCEGFMKRVYSNVDSFKTESVSDLENSLVVEGIITFNKDEKGRKTQARTNFNFTECYTNGKKVLFSGENKTFSKNKHPFKIKGSVEDGEFLPESFQYSYSVKQLNESNTEETVKVSGKVILK